MGCSDYVLYMYMYECLVCMYIFPILEVEADQFITLIELHHSSQSVRHTPSLSSVDQAHIVKVR